MSITVPHIKSHSIGGNSGSSALTVDLASTYLNLATYVGSAKTTPPDFPYRHYYYLIINTFPNKLVSICTTNVQEAGAQ